MATHLQEGQKAPAFSSKDQDGNKISLKDYAGKKLVLYFYPKDDTPGCTIQARNLRDHISVLKEKGFEVVGVSPDDAESHKMFEKKFGLPFPLLADTDHAVIEKYGVWGEKNLYGKKSMGVIRTTFIIDEEGKIVKIFNRPDTKAHSEEIIAAMGE